LRHSRSRRTWRSFLAAPADHRRIGKKRRTNLVGVAQPSLAAGMLGETEEITMAPTTAPTVDEYWSALQPHLTSLSLEERRAAKALYRELANGEPVDDARLAKALNTSTAEALALLAARSDQLSDLRRQPRTGRRFWWPRGGAPASPFRGGRSRTFDMVCLGQPVYPRKSWDVRHASNRAIRRTAKPCVSS
jgi:hypothetical protein